MKTSLIVLLMATLPALFSMKAYAQDSKKVAAGMNPKVTELREFNYYKECKWVMDTAAFNWIVLASIDKNYFAENVDELIEEGRKSLGNHEPVAADRKWFSTGLENLKGQLKRTAGKKKSQISGNYILFFELMAKAYLFNEAVVATAGYTGDQPYANNLLNNSISETGNQDVFDYIIGTYGCVPEKLMPDGLYLKKPDGLFDNVSAILARGARIFRKLNDEYVHLYKTYEAEKSLMIDRPDRSHKKDDYAHVEELAKRCKLLQELLLKTRTETMVYVYRYLCEELGVPPTDQTIQEKKF